MRTVPDWSRRRVLRFPGVGVVGVRVSIAACFGVAWITLVLCAVDNEPVS